MTKAEAISLLQEVLEYQTFKGQRIVWFTDENVRCIIEVLKSDAECENCEIAIEDRQKVVRCKDCVYGNMSIDDRPYRLPCRQNDQLSDWFCADGKRR